jgi:hypothetical protein
MYQSVISPRTLYQENVLRSTALYDGKPFCLLCEHVKMSIRDKTGMFYQTNFKKFHSEDEM